MDENVMRGAMARFGQLLEVVMVSVGFNLVVYSASLYAVQVMRTAKTAFEYTVALYIIASAMVMAAKGAEQLHRKWSEYAQSEAAAETSSASAWRNPSIQVSAKSRNSVMIVNVLAVATLAGLVVVVSSYQIFLLAFPISALARIIPPLAVAIYAASVWANASK